MSERRVGLAKRRKTQMFLHSVLPVVKTHEEVVKEKLEGGKFLFTVTGILKLIGNLSLLVAIALFLSSSKCPKTSEWYPFLLPITCGVTVLVSFALYFVFSLGYTVKNPYFWIKLDVFTNLILSITTIVSNVFTVVNCHSSRTLHNIPGPLAISGSTVLIVSCASIFLMYRYTDEDDEPETAVIPKEAVYRKPDPRKSIFA